MSTTSVMAWYCGVTMLMSSLCFLLRALLLADAANSRISKASFYVKPVEVAAWVFAWYGISVSMVISNRWLFHEWRGDGFPYPILATAIHMWLKVFLSRLILWMQGVKPARLERSVLYWTVVPIGLTTALDILLSNFAFLFVNVSFYTILKSGSVIWIALWAIVFKFEVATPKLCGLVGFMSIGLLLASWGEAEFSILGMFLVLGASCLSGLRWGLVQLLQGIEPSCNDALLVLYYISPSSAILASPLSLFDIFEEGVKGLYLDDAGALVEVLGIVAALGLISFFLIFAEVKLLAITSSLTTGVFGTLKEVVQIAMGALVLKEEVSMLNILGLVIALVGTWAYKLTRSQQRVTEGDLWEAEDNVRVSRRVSGMGSRRSRQEKRRQGGANSVYEAVSRQEVADELRVFKCNHTDWDLESELEEFSPSDSL
ncbi:unnamed protein product [Choristocarpus tenellus]